jgi:ATP-binding cassette subfamily G (WHITE) protein 2 (PDR)
MVAPQSPAPVGAAAPAAQIEHEILYVLRQGEPRLNSEDVHGRTSTGDSTEKDSVNGIGFKERDEITHLARQISELSHRNSDDQSSESFPNTFLNTEADPELNPNSEKFNQRKWVRNIFQIVSHDPERYPRRTTGVSFRNLNAYGYGTAADYQMNVANAWLKPLDWVKGVLGAREKLRIDILRQFEGLVRSGEMLVVLGRPGRCVSHPTQRCQTAMLTPAV